MTSQTTNISFFSNIRFLRSFHADRGMQMNRAMFTMNGHCGYVLKPAPLRLASGEVCNHDKAPSFVKSYPLDITIEVRHKFLFRLTID